MNFVGVGRFMTILKSMAQVTVQIKREKLVAYYKRQMQEMLNDTATEKWSLPKPLTKEEHQHLKSYADTIGLKIECTKMGNSN